MGNQQMGNQMGMQMGNMGMGDPSMGMQCGQMGMPPPPAMDWLQGFSQMAAGFSQILDVS
jgi:hypothetical protein